MKSLKNEILKLAAGEYPSWIGGIRFEKLALELMRKPSNASRRARELQNEGKLEAEYSEGYVRYKYVPEKEMTQDEILKLALQ